MILSPKKTLFTFTLSADEARNKRATEILDQSGIDYQIVEFSEATSDHDRPPGSAAGRSLPELRCGDDVVSEFDRQTLVDFLWAHGAQFEDS